MEEEIEEKRCRFFRRGEERTRMEWNRAGRRKTFSHRMWPVARLGGERVCPEHIR
jgi:hypothetical protein